MSAQTKIAKPRGSQPAAPELAPVPAGAGALPAPVRPPVAETPTYWADRWTFALWLTCAALLMLMNVLDTLVGLFTR